MRVCVKTSEHLIIVTDECFPDSVLLAPSKNQNELLKCTKREVDEKKNQFFHRQNAGLCVDVTWK